LIPPPIAVEADCKFKKGVAAVVVTAVLLVHAMGPPEEEEDNDDVAMVLLVAVTVSGAAMLFNGGIFWGMTLFGAATVCDCGTVTFLKTSGAMPKPCKRAWVLLLLLKDMLKATRRSFRFVGFGLFWGSGWLVV
jgi:hypothetical protein